MQVHDSNLFQNEIVNQAMTPYWRYPNTFTTQNDNHNGRIYSLADKIQEQAIFG